jgi:hypothetical protein
LFATVITLILVPCLYIIVYDFVHEKHESLDDEELATPESFVEQRLV